MVGGMFRRWFLCLALVAGTRDVAATQEVPRYSTPQNMPCSDQPRSLKQLVAAFDRGHRPAPTQINGTWVAIGLLRYSPSLNCTGVTRGGRVFEWVMFVAHDSVEIDMIGRDLLATTLTLDSAQAATFSADFGADGGPDEYRCRLTDRGTLACLTGRANWLGGMELKKMTVTDGQRASRIREP
jgi:hypothetical protein